MRWELICCIIVAWWGISALCTFYHIRTDWMRPYVYFYLFIMLAIWISKPRSATTK